MTGFHAHSELPLQLRGGHPKLARVIRRYQSTPRPVPGEYDVQAQGCVESVRLTTPVAAVSIDRLFSAPFTTHISQP